MAGLTKQGFEIKRLLQIISDLEREAKNQYGENVSTDTNSVLGRALRINAPSLSDLWEAAEEVYDSFDPTKAEGVSLDALVALGGLTRFDARPTTSPVVLVAEKDTELPRGALASSSFTNIQYALKTPVYFNLKNIIALQAEPVNAIEGNTYSISFDNSTVSYTAQAGDTIPDIVSGLMSEFSPISNFSASLIEEFPNRLYITSEDIFKTFNFEVD